MLCPAVYPPDPTLGIAGFPRCSRTRRSSRAVGITRIGRVRSAASLALGIGSGPAPCMISAIRWGGGT